LNETAILKSHHAIGQREAGQPMNNENNGAVSMVSGSAAKIATLHLEHCENLRHTNTEPPKAKTLEGYSHHLRSGGHGGGGRKGAR
jgi:hypothetical protein